VAVVAVVAVVKMAKPKQVAAKALGIQRETKMVATTKNKKKKAAPASEAHGVGRTGTVPFESAVRLLHRQSNPGLKISHACVAQLNGVLVHLCERLVDAAVDNARLAKVSTLASKHVLCAAEGSLPLELAARAVQDAEGAQAAYNQSGDAE
jgi:hypothetical protein